MIFQKSLPSLRPRILTTHHVFRDRRLGDLKAKHQKLAMDPGCAPQRVFPLPIQRILLEKRFSTLQKEFKLAYTASACGLTVVLAISVSASSVFFSSRRVWSSSRTASCSPSS